MEEGLFCGDRVFFLAFPSRQSSIEHNILEIERDLPRRFDTLDSSEDREGFLLALSAR